MTRNFRSLHPPNLFSVLTGFAQCVIPTDLFREHAETAPFPCTLRHFTLPPWVGQDRPFSPGLRQDGALARALARPRRGVPETLLLRPSVVRMARLNFGF